MNKSERMDRSDLEKIFKGYKDYLEKERALFTDVRARRNAFAKKYFKDELARPIFDKQKMNLYRQFKRLDSIENEIKKLDSEGTPVADNLVAQRRVMIEIEDIKASVEEQKEEFNKLSEDLKAILPEAEAENIIRFQVDTAHLTADNAKKLSESNVAFVESERDRIKGLRENRNKLADEYGMEGEVSAVLSLQQNNLKVQMTVLDVLEEHNESLEQSDTTSGRRRAIGSIGSQKMILEVYKEKFEKLSENLQKAIAWVEKNSPMDDERVKELTGLHNAYVKGKVEWYEKINKKRAKLAKDYVGKDVVQLALLDLQSTASNIRNRVRRIEEAIAEFRDPSQTPGERRMINGRIEELKKTIEKYYNKNFKAAFEKLEKAMTVYGKAVPMDRAEVQKVEEQYRAYAELQRKRIGALNSDVNKLEARSNGGESILAVAKRKRDNLDLQSTVIDELERYINNFSVSNTLYDQISYMHLFKRAEEKIEAHIREYIAISEKDAPLSEDEVSQKFEWYRAYVKDERARIEALRAERSSLKNKNKGFVRANVLFRDMHKNLESQMRCTKTIESHMDKYVKYPHKREQYLKWLDAVPASMEAYKSAYEDLYMKLQAILPGDDKTAPMDKAKTEAISQEYRAYVASERERIKKLRAERSALVEQYAENGEIQSFLELQRMNMSRQIEKLIRIEEHIDEFLSAQTFHEQRNSVNSIKIIKQNIEADKKDYHELTGKLQGLLQEAAVNDSRADQAKNDAGAGILKGYMTEITAVREAADNKNPGMPEQAMQGQAQEGSTHSARNIKKPEPFNK